MTYKDFGITKREFEVLCFVVLGLSNKEIADKLFVTKHTVKAHVGSILVKLKVRSKIKAAVFAVRMGWA